MFATLAGFALAQGAALTVAAKGEGRDQLVVIIYIVVVVFSYAWTRQILSNGETLNSFDATTVAQGRFTLAWIIFLGTIMVGLAWYGLLPNQKWRSFYNNTGKIACVARGANEYATPQDTELQEARKWIKWTAESSSKDSFWIESAAGLRSNFETFHVRFEHLPRFKNIELVAFLRSQDNPSVMPEYRQLAVQKPPQGSTDQKWSIIVAEPNEGDNIVVLCRANDIESKGANQRTVDPNDSFWMMPFN